MEYTILSCEDQGLLCDAVQQFINAGWKPQGGVAVSQTVMDHPGHFNMPGTREYVVVFCQAMVKE